jgi:hypothetical protein
MAFHDSGSGVIAEADWAISLTIGSAVFSASPVHVYRDGSTKMLVQKGLFGVPINLLIIEFVLPVLTYVTSV